MKIHVISAKTIALSFSLIFSGFAFSDSNSILAKENTLMPLSVSGNKIMMGDSPTSFSGASFFWSNFGGDRFYNAKVVSWLKKDWGVKVVRSAMGVEEAGGYIHDPVGQKALAEKVIQAAIDNELYVIVDWHTHHAEKHPEQAIEFFTEMATKYGHLPNVIYEIYNEPLGDTSWSKTIKPYATKVISAIRKIDPDNLIIVGTRTWSQEVEEAADDRIEGKNIAYTLHYYIGAHGKGVREKAKRALEKGVALFVTEWGIWPPCSFTTPDALPCRGDDKYFDKLTDAEQAEVDAWKNFLVANHIPSAAWSISDKSEPSSYLYSGASTNGNWKESDLTGSGKAVRKMIKEINGVD